jgi:hypothetical protein
VLFATHRGVFRVSVNGGSPKQVVGVGDGETIFGPQMLPDNDHLLLTVTKATGVNRWDKAQVVAYSLSSRTRTVLVEGGADGRWLKTGHIVYAVGDALFALPVDLRPLRTLGAPVKVLSGVRRAAVPAVNTASAFFAIAENGHLAYIPGETETPINVVVDMNGRTTALPDRDLRAMRVSPDGSRMVALHEDAWWIYSLARREAPRRVADAREAHTNPVWAPDGTSITFRSRPRSAMVLVPADGTAGAELLLAVEGVPIGWSDDAKTLFYIFDRQLWAWRRGEEPRSIMPMNSPYASLSPDRQWVAYHTNDRDKAYPYIRSLSDSGAAFQVTRAGGHAPLWSPDGRRLFYVSGETNSLVTIDVQTAPAVSFGEPAVLLPEIRHGLALSERYFDITPDGTRLLVLVPDRDQQSRRIEVVLNWFEDLKSRVPRP